MLPVGDQDGDGDLEAAVRPLQGETMPEDARERGDHEAVQREGHGHGAKDEVHAGQSPVRALWDLELDETLEGEAGDHRGLRRQVGVPLHVEVELRRALTTGHTSD